jgi:hypothetical protein
MIAWADANQRYLAAALSVVRATLDRHAGRQTDDPAELEVHTRECARALPAPSALDQLCAAFALSTFERNVLLMCAGYELDAAFAASCDDRPTFSLALAAFPDAHWSALAPGAPLRHWRLVDLGAGATVATSPLRVDERILHHLTGIAYLDDRLRGLVEPVASTFALPRSHAAIAEAIAGYWDGAVAPPFVQLTGAEPARLRTVAASACRMLGLGAFRLRARDVPTVAAERDAIGRLWEREATLGGSALILEVEDDSAGDLERAAIAFVELMGGYVIATSRDPLTVAHRTTLHLEVGPTTPDERETFWRDCLGDLAAGLDGALAAAALQFDLTPQALHAVRLRLNRAAGHEVAPDALWSACREQARVRLEDLSERIEPTAGWDDLVLPPEQIELLRELVVHVRHRATVYGEWGFAGRSPRGLGISALFAGPSGTGKTMAAEVVSRALRLDLFRIDLSQVVSKYIGETEKNLRRVFDAAETSGAVLLFDEADALFGKRSEVKDSHDRYANIEISYLLQRMEAYRGLAILTTNRRRALDEAFLRRIRFVVQFPFPGPEQRAAIWRRVFPDETPTEQLRPDQFAKLNVAGGNIRNIALSAAFLAADANEPVRTEHVLRAARREYTKLERPLVGAKKAGSW